MKLSEAIRFAADNYLSATFEDNMNEQKRVRLWNALSRAVGTDKANELLKDADEDRTLPYYFDAASFHNCQCIRFMYLEFLALQAEDDEAKYEPCQEALEQDIVRRFAFQQQEN